MKFAKKMVYDTDANKFLPVNHKSYEELNYN